MEQNTRAVVREQFIASRLPYTEVERRVREGFQADKNTIEISADGFWVINGEKTEHKATGTDGKGVQSATITNGSLVLTYTDGKTANLGEVVGGSGNDGHTPYIQNGYWYINGENLGVKAEYSLADYPVQSVNGKTGKVEISASDVEARPNTWIPTAAEVGARANDWTPSYDEVGADKSGTAAAAVSEHNTNNGAHNDIRLELKALADRISAVLDSDDTTLDELSEIVAYIKSNKGLIDAITTNKVNVTDIINDLMTNVTNKPLSAAQGVALKSLYDALNQTVTALGNTKLDASALTSAINTALAQAKASGDFDGKAGDDGVGISSIAKTGTSGLVDTYTITFTNGSKTTFTVTNAENGVDGERGTGILKVTTAPTAYTTATGGKTPTHRIALSTVISQSGVDKVLVGDLIAQSYYQYHVYYLDDTYAYIDSRQSVRGASGAAGTSVTVSNVSESTESGGSNVVSFSDGNTLTVNNGLDGKNGTDGKTPVKYVDYYTDGDIADMVTAVMEAIGCPLFGVIDENKHITFSGKNIPDGTYTWDYKMENGTRVPGGTFVLDTNTYYNVSKTIDANCTINNSATKVAEGTKYTATISAKDGYKLKTVTATMNGSSAGVTISGDETSKTITIANVTGNIIISAVAEASGPAYTNQIPLSIGTDGKPFNNGQGYKTGYRLSLSGGSESAQDGTEVTGFIKVTKNSVIRIKNIAYADDTTRGVVGYDANFNKLSTGNGMAINNMFVVNGFDDGNGVRRTNRLDYYTHFASDSLKYIRLCSTDINANSILTVDEPIV